MDAPVYAEALSGLRGESQLSHLLLSGGENLPADGIFEIAEELQIDESVLTGESLSIIKQNGADYFNAEVEHDGIYVESRCLGYAGSRVQT